MKSDKADSKKPPELDFGATARKSRLTNRRGRTAMGNNWVFAGAWGFRYSPRISNEDGKEESTGHGSDSPSIDPFGGTECARDGASGMNSVRQWLEGIGFGRYAGVRPLGLGGSCTRRSGEWPEISQRGQTRIDSDREMLFFCCSD